LNLLSRLAANARFWESLRFVVVSEATNYDRRQRDKAVGSQPYAKQQRLRYYFEMTLTRKFQKSVMARVERDPAFAKALLDEAATLFLIDEPETARAILRGLVNATLGFGRHAEMTETPRRRHGKSKGSTRGI